MVSSSFSFTCARATELACVSWNSESIVVLLCSLLLLLWLWIGSFQLKFSVCVCVVFVCLTTCPLTLSLYNRTTQTRCSHSCPLWWWLPLTLAPHPAVMLTPSPRSQSAFTPWGKAALQCRCSSKSTQCYAAHIMQSQSIQDIILIFQKIP